MAIDLELTIERALEEIGDTAKAEEMQIVNEFTNFNTLGDFLFYEEPLAYKATWTFHKSSKRVINYNHAIKMQESVSLDSKEYKSAQEAYLGSVAHTYISDFLIEYLKENELKPSIVFKTHSLNGAGVEDVEEWVDNAIEHGTNFCEAGDVKVEFHGGNKGFLYFIDHPGNGFELKLDTKRAEQITWQFYEYELNRKNYNKDYFDKTKKEANDFFMEAPRGMGLVGATLQKLPIINAFQTETGFRTIVLYRFEDFKKEAPKDL